MAVTITDQAPAVEQAADAPASPAPTATGTMGATRPWPPGPAGHWLLGHMSDFVRDQLGFITRCAREYGDFVPIRFGPSSAVLISSPEAIEEVLVAKHRSFHKTPAFRTTRRFLGQGLVTSEGELWRRQRRLIQPGFHRQRIAAYAETMVAETTAMLEAPTDLGGWRDGQARDVAQDMMALTMRIVCKTLFGADVGSDTAQTVAPLLREIGEYVNSRLYSLLFWLPDSVPTPGNLRLRRAVRELDAIIFRIIDEHRRHGQDTGDLLSMLLAARDEDDGSGMTPSQLRDEVMTLFLAGHDTTALALTWTWYLLSLYPSVAAKLRDELAEALGGRAPTLADLPRLRYAEMVVTEAMRLYPPAWTVGRQAIEDCTVGGYRVPKGTVVFMSQWVVHRDPRWYQEPARFWPERWADDLAKRLPKYAYFPFGGGPRVCIGNSFAQLEATLLLATIVEQYRLEVQPGHPVVPQTYLTMRPKYGMPVTLHHW